MFDPEDLLAEKRPLGGDLGRRPHKLLTNILSRKPHRFLPPNVPELVVPADHQAQALITEMYEDVEAAGGLTALRALRSVIERPRIRVAGLPIASGGRDYYLASAVDAEELGVVCPVLSVRVVRDASSRRSSLVGIRCRIITGEDLDSLRNELAHIYQEAEGRRKLLDGQTSAVWLRGAGAGDLEGRWELELEAVAATYGFRLTVSPSPDANVRDFVRLITRDRPSIALVWDHDGRSTEITAKLSAALGTVDRILIYGTWTDALAACRRELAAKRGTAEPTRVAPRSVIDAVTQAATHPDVIVLDAAVKSAEASVFRRPADVLTAVNTLVDAIAAGALGAPGGLALALEGSPFRYAAGVSDTAHQQYRADYVRKYDGRDILLGPHLKLGAGSPEFCLRIYWYVDVDKQRVVIGHIGEHLRDAGS